MAIDFEEVPTTDDSLIRTGWRLSSQPQYRLDERLVELLNEQIGLELRAFYTYTSMVNARKGRNTAVGPLDYFQASHFNRDDSAFPGFQRFFRHSAAEELSHAESQMDFMAKRGAPVQLGSLPAPCDPQVRD